MAFTKDTKRELTIFEDGVISILRRTTISEDGEVVAEKLHRELLSPGDDLTGQPQRIAAIADLVWTPAVVADFALKRAAALASIGSLAP